MNKPIDPKFCKKLLQIQQDIYDLISDNCSSINYMTGDILTGHAESIGRMHNHYTTQKRGQWENEN